MTVRSVLGAALVALVFAGLGASASARNAASHADVAGDAAGEGADVTAIAVSNDDVRQVTWQISLPNRTGLLDGDRVTLWLDLDSNPATGRPESGSEMSVVVWGPTSGRSTANTSVSRWIGEAEVSVFAVPVFTSWDPGTRVLSVSVNQRFMEFATTFGYVVESTLFDFRRGVVTGSDRAPNAGAFPYEIIGDRQSPTVQARAASGKRGKVAVLRYRVEDENPTSELITITRGGRRVARFATKLRVFRMTNVVFRWRIPKELAPGTLRYCVVAEDESRNKSAPGCATARVR